MDLASLEAYLSTGAGASIDTRTLSQGEVFFALPGSQQHGAAFAQEAHEKGAAFLVLPEGYPAPPTVPPEKVFYHPDPLQLLGQVAAQHRRRFSMPVIAVAGSNGKTTTKALIGHLLGAYAPTLVSPRSWNNAIGLPLTLLRLRPEHRFAVIEIGDNRSGEVATLCRMADPTWGILTNIGADHLEGYGSLTANLAAKWELVEYLAAYTGRLLLLNSEDTHLKNQPLPAGIKVAYFGAGPKTLVRGIWRQHAWEIAYLQGEIAGEAFSLTVPLWGSYNRLNVLAALAVGHLLGLSIRKMGQALASFQPEAYRSQILTQGERRIIADAYNANPSSLQASLTALWESLPTGQKAALVLGQMEELGSYAKQAHTEALNSLTPHASRIAGIALVGELWQSAWSAPFFPFPVVWAQNTASLLEQLPAWFREAPIVYLKGSRAQALERLLPALEKI